MLEKLPFDVPEEVSEKLAKLQLPEKLAKLEMPKDLPKLPKNLPKIDLPKLPKLPWE